MSKVRVRARVSRGKRNYRFELSPPIRRSGKSFRFISSGVVFATQTVGKIERKTIAHLETKAQLIKTQILVGDLSFLPDDLELIHELIHKHTKKVLLQAFLVGCLTGLRYGDIIKLTPDSIQGGRIRLKQQKTNSEVVIPIGNKMCLKWLKNLNTLPSLSSSERFNPLRKIMQKRYGKDLVFHSSRKSFIVGLLNNGVDIYTVSRLAGHKDIKTTAIYAELTDNLIDRVGAML